MKARARIEVDELMMFCDEIIGIEIEIVAPEFQNADNSAVYCDTVDEALEMLRMIKASRRAIAESTP